MKIAPAPVRLRAIEDIDAMAAAIADGLEAEYVQLEAGPFVGHWTVVSLGGMVLQFGREDVAVVRRVRIPAGTWAFVVPLAVAESARWNARVIHGNELIVCAPGSECHACDPGGTEFAIVSVREGSTAAALARAFLAAGTTDCTVLPRARDARRLQRRLGAILAASSAAIDASAVRRDIGSLLDSCLENAVPGEGPVDASLGRNRIVRRAEEFFRCHVGEPVSIAQLSSIAGVSERSLRNAFNDVYTTSPKRYLRLWQLHQVRRALRAADGQEATVTNVATFHGFYELGRFAGEYKALFGEAPSQTLHRTRTENATRALGAA